MYFDHSNSFTTVLQHTAIINPVLTFNLKCKTVAFLGLLGHIRWHVPTLCAIIRFIYFFY